MFDPRCGLIAIRNSTGAFDGVLWMAGLLAAILLAVAGLAWFRRRMRRSEEEASGHFSMEDLRRLRNRGVLSEAEFSALRTALIEGVQGGSVQK